MRRNWLEWIVLVVSALLIIGIVGFLVVDGLADEGGPPVPVVTLHRDEAYEAEGSWLLPATVRNDGSQAAEAVVLRATATVADVEEEAELTIDYLPAGTSIELAFGFSDAPDGEVSVETIGFRLP